MQGCSDLKVELCARLILHAHIVCTCITSHEVFLSGGYFTKVNIASGKESVLVPGLIVQGL